MKIFGLTVSVVVPENYEQQVEDMFFNGATSVGKGANLLYTTAKAGTRGAVKGVSKAFGNNSADRIAALEAQIQQLLNK